MLGLNEKKKFWRVNLRQLLNNSQAYIKGKDFKYPESKCLKANLVN